MPTYKFHYFNTYARGETARILFKLGDCPFEDIKIDPADWPQIKSTTIIGFLPFLEIDDVIIAQSHAIDKYLAKQFGYAGKTPVQEAQVDMVAGTVEDVFTGPKPVILCQDENEKPKLVAEYLAHVNGVLATVEKLLGMNSGGNGYFVGDSLTWADIHVYCSIDFCERVTKASLYDNYPKLSGLKQRIEAEPKIAEHLKNRAPAKY